MAPRREILVWDLAHSCVWRRFTGFDAEVTCLAFSPDGSRLVSGLADSTLLIWNVGAPAKPPTGKLGAEVLAAAWADLAANDARRAFQARWTLVDEPAKAVPLLKKHLEPVRRADSRQVQQLLDDLDSPRFAVRSAAQKALADLGELAAPALRQALAKSPSLERSLRAEALLDKLRWPVTQPELLRATRAVAVLEDIATPDARSLLRTLAGGAPEARLTREAQAALQRLAR
jgi:hypothetical protein